MGREETVAQVRQITDALRSAGIALPGLSTAAVADAALVGRLPAWVARFGPLSDGQNTWVYCEPHRQAEPLAPGQILLRLPAGRYLVDTFDTGSRAFWARESAAGDPLVVGLASSGFPLLLWIRLIICEPS
jgi:hypothetical protein